MAYDRTDYYTVPAGVRLCFDRGLGYLDLGNLVSPSIEMAIETLEHFSSRSGTRGRDKTRVTSRAMTLTASLDEINPNNLQLMFGGGAISDVAAGISQITDEVVTLSGTDVSTFSLPLSAVTPGVVVKSPDGLTTYTATDDYLVDTLAGGIKRAASGSEIEDGDQVKASYNWDAPARQKFPILAGARVEGFVRFVMQPTDGPQVVIRSMKAEIIANGSLTLDDTAWMELPITINVLENLALPSSPFGELETWLKAA